MVGNVVEGWAGAPGSRGLSCATLSYFGKCIQILEFICSMWKILGKAGHGFTDEEPEPG